MVTSGFGRFQSGRIATRAVDQTGTIGLGR